MSKPEIADRTLAYAIRAVRLFRHLQKQRDGAALIIGRQYLRSATSVGANLAEAISGETKKDFVHKLSIAQKEARESLYGLRILTATEVVSTSRLEPLVQETTELIAILTAIIVKTKRNAAKR
jgi:four helix bundle protein